AVEAKPQDEPQISPEVTIQVPDNNNAETVCTNPQGPIAIKTTNTAAFLSNTEQQIPQGSPLVEEQKDDLNAQVPEDGNVVAPHNDAE
ncbi:hypothetical protein A2U01_0083195, partial [Trifolium medium]|nr:hypothetical protein [Trifolium medium]